MLDSELVALLRDRESDRVERKESIADGKKIRQAICAFANDLPNHQQPGVLFIGVRDDGRCAEAAITDELLLNLANIRSEGKILPFPTGQMKPIGYVILQHGVRFDRPVRAFQRWIERIPEVYSAKVLQESDRQFPTPASDRNRLALLKHYQSLMPLAQEARKPIFHLKPADGAIGAHLRAVRAVQADFQALAQTIAQRVGLELLEWPGVDESVLATRP